ncbi:nuclear transport factor 2 family protein [Sphingobacterium bovistauri]|uniref:Nuclear transport factor 2 family protein n=1 Tax=Sphingobacterium bovistauri TaxID=2781959 RepID=A0ABS7Z821_9SPHI|nr:nuclear transport factor 2 family protein [Sphingobacterium bovistauri]MCA5006353.1 nuclear transport factor 2 family protein [Sphingobacterium bovistauri]
MTKSEIAQAFSNGDFDKCFEYLTDNTIWNTPGEQLLTGKQEIETFCKSISNYFDSVTTNFQQLNVIENTNCVAINGTAEFIRDGKSISFVSSCDVYVFHKNHSIKSITSYCITERPTV